MNTTLRNWGMALIGTAAFLGAAAWLDGPSEADIAQAQALDLADAQDQAQRERILQQRCEALRGPRAELVMIRGTDDYACRLDGSI